MVDHKNIEAPSEGVSAFYVFLIGLLCLAVGALFGAQGMLMEIKRGVSKDLEEIKSSSVSDGYVIENDVTAPRHAARARKNLVHEAPGR